MSATEKKADPPVRVETWREHMRDSWFTFDRRTLGLTRICLGFFLIMDLFRRTADWEDMFADVGVLPTWLMLNRPQSSGFSILNGFTTAPELWALWVVILATYVCLFVGYKTKLAQILSLLFVTSMNGRVLLIENGGYVVHNLLLLWTCFMPLGDRFSVDGLRISMRRRRERTAGELNDRTDLDEPWRMSPFVSFVGLVLIIQLAAIYYFNVIHKTGPAWKRDWTAVHYVMYVDRMVNPLVALAREHVPFFMFKGLTLSVIFGETAVAFCVLTNRLVIGGFNVQLWLRRFALALINFLHIGFGSTFVLGPFAWALCVFSTLLFAKEDWEVTIRAMRRTHRERTILFDPDSGALLLFCRLIVRMDRFDLLGFDEAKGTEKKQGLAVLTPDGTIKTGHAALADIIAALPTGPSFSWIVRLPVVRGLVDSLMSFGRGRTSSFFGLSTELPAPAETPELKVRLRRAGRVVSEVLCVAMFVGAVNQALVELWVTKKWWSGVIAGLNEKPFVKNKGWKIDAQPEPTRLLSHKLRFLQGWFMFSPNPVMDDGTIIVDAVTIDGRHVDPFWQKEPNFDLLNAKSFGYNQIWSDYFNRMHLAGNRGFRDAMVDYMRRLPERTGNPNDELVSGEVYWVKDMNPKWKTTKSWNQQRDLLFSFGKEGGAKDAQNRIAKPPGS